MTEYKTLAGGFKIPAIGYGTASKEGPEFEAALHKALEAGYRHIDTAFIYKSEAAIGRVLKNWIPTGKLKREDIFITSKYRPLEEQEQDVENLIKKSLDDLQLDYVDLYLIHRPLDDATNIDMWKKLEQQVDAGRAKYIGLSNFTIEQIDAILKIARIKPVNLQIQLHLYRQRKELVEYCKKNNISVVAWSPLGSPGRTHGEPLNILQDEVLKKIADKYNKLPSQVALRFLIQKDIVPIPKSLNDGRIIENFNVFNFTLTEEDVKELEGLDKNLIPAPRRPPPKNN